MSDKFITTTGVMDDAADTVARIASPWLGVLWATSLPLRLMQVYLLTEVGALGSDVRQYGNYLSGLAMVTMVAFLVSVWGRTVYARACRLSLELRASPGVEAVRVAPSTLFTHAYTALLSEALFFMFLWSFVAAPLFVLFSGLAAASAHTVERPNPFAPLRAILKAAADAPKGLMIVFLITVPAAWVNLYFLVQAVMWMVSGLVGIDLSAWQHLLRPVHPFFPFFPAEPLVMLLVTVATVLAIEPFWLSSLSIYISRLEERGTGEDLRRWFAALREDRS